MLDPTEEETAMSPSPFRATRTDVIKSGIDVPADNSVNPIISGGMSKFSPTNNQNGEKKTSKNRLNTFIDVAKNEKRKMKRERIEF